MLISNVSLLKAFQSIVFMIWQKQISIFFIIIYLFRNLKFPENAGVKTFPRMEYNFCGSVYDENGTDKKVSMIKIIDNDNNVTFSNGTENNKFSMKKNKIRLEGNHHYSYHD